MDMPKICCFVENSSAVEQCVDKCKDMGWDLGDLKFDADIFGHDRGDKFNSWYCNKNNSRQVKSVMDIYFPDSKMITFDEFIAWGDSPIANVIPIVDDKRYQKLNVELLTLCTNYERMYKAQSELIVSQREIIERMSE